MWAFRSSTLPPSSALKKKAACSSDVSRLSTQEAIQPSVAKSFDLSCTFDLSSRIVPRPLSAL
jgi:hypothetical protein